LRIKEQETRLTLQEHDDDDDDDDGKWMENKLDRSFWKRRHMTWNQGEE